MSQGQPTPPIQKGRGSQLMKLWSSTTMVSCNEADGVILARPKGKRIWAIKTEKVFWIKCPNSFMNNSGVGWIIHESRLPQVRASGSWNCSELLWRGYNEAVVVRLAREQFSLEAPPVRKLNKHTVICLGVMAQFIPYQVIVQAKEKDRSRLQYPAKQETAIKLSIEMVVIENGA